MRRRNFIKADAGEASPDLAKLPPPARGSSPLLILLLSACLIELLYLLLLALAPLPELRFDITPMGNAWPWTLALSHAIFPAAWNLRSMLNQDWPYDALLGVTLVILFASYAFVIDRVFRLKSSDDASTHWLLLIVAGAGIFGLTLLFQPALFSNEVFNSIFSGRLLTIYSVDPMITAPFQFAHDPYLPLVLQPTKPVFYGPLFLTIASLLTRVSSDSAITLLLFKGVALLFHLLNCFCIWFILTKVAPGRRLVGVLLYAWNPLVLIELAGSGHNEGMLLTLLLLATLVYVQGKGSLYETGALLLFGLAVSANLIALLVVPLYIWFSVRIQQDPGQAIWSFCWRFLFVLAIASLMYLPFWHGAATFFAITSAADWLHFVNSPLSVLAYPLRGLFGLLAQASHFPPDLMQPTTAADATLLASTTLIFVLFYITLLGRVRRASTSVAEMRNNLEAEAEMILPGFDMLVTSWSGAILGYLVCVSAVFTPWYVLWLVWSIALRRFDGFTASVLLLSGTALLTYPLLHFASSPLTEFQPILIFGIPLVYWIMDNKRRSERKRLVYDR